MWKFTKKDKRTAIEKEIDSVLEQMTKLDPTTKEYTDANINLERLAKVKSEIKSGISKDTLLIVAGSLVGTILVLYFEKTDVLTSKATNWILKGRV